MLYQSSKGAVDIDTMNYSHALNSLHKLERTEPGRVAEIEALEAHIAKLDAEHAAKALAPGANNPPEEIAVVSVAPAEEPAPVLEGRNAVEIHVADLLVEAGNWTDGIAIETQGQADSVSRLRRMLQQAGNLVDETAAEEKKPHNEAITEIGVWQNGFTAKGLKKTPDGKITKTLSVLGRLDTAWLVKLDNERKAREAVVAAEAAKAAAAALEAHQAAQQTTDIAVVEDAEDMLAAAKAMLKQAEGVSKERVHSGGGGGFRASTLRSFWTAEITDARAALIHYLNAQPEAFKALTQELASKDALNEATRRAIPGVKFHEEKRAA